MKYNPWPLGNIPKAHLRPELELIREMGYLWDDPRDAISIFEKKVAEFSGCKYAVSVDCCSNGLFLCLKYYKDIQKEETTKIKIPKQTYISVPLQIEHAGFEYEFVDCEWSGIYQLAPLLIYDGAVRWTKDMYEGIGMQVVSFQIKKRVPIGKGGMILTNDKKQADWLRLMSYDGRDLTLPYDHPEHIKCKGYHMYMTPEDAARGILLMDSLPEINEDSGNHTMYPDLSKMMIFK
jgi:dTDP-4-amino-4,6-dideoxygalactose transaminase